jgi:hypothetical protein
MRQGIVCSYEDLGIRERLAGVVFAEMQGLNPQTNTNGRK